MLTRHAVAGYQNHPTILLKDFWTGVRAGNAVAKALKGYKQNLDAEWEIKPGLD